MHRENSKMTNVFDLTFIFVSMHFVLNLISSCSIDPVLQMFNFPHLSINQEVFISCKKELAMIDFLTFRCNKRCSIVVGISILI